MAPTTAYPKAERALRLLLGLRDPRVAAALAARGFGDRDLREGWALLRRLGVETVEAARPARLPAGPPGRLEAWQAKWLPVASAALGRRAPEAHAWLLRDLDRSAGPVAVVAVATFVARYERLAAPPAAGGLGALGEGARAAMAERGLGEAAVGEAKALLAAPAGAPAAGPPGGATAAGGGGDGAFDEAERALAAWCRAWGAALRAELRDRPLCAGSASPRPGGGPAGGGARASAGRR